MRILIMGLPGAGKTTLAAALTVNLFPNCVWLNADTVREQFNDWDFSHEGRIRQAKRMRQLADGANKEFVIADFVAPLKEMRDIYEADIIVWVDTLDASIYEDTNRVFEKPEHVDVHVTTQDAEYWSFEIVKKILDSQ